MIDMALFDMRNPWRHGRPFTTPWLIRRELQTLTAWADNSFVIVITGPRQAGKTTLMLMFIQQLLAKGIPPADIFYFTGDDPGVADLMDNPASLVQFLRDMHGERHAWVFIDEAQRLPEPGLALKRFIDLNLPAKFVVSGSSSLEIRSKTHEHLVGRSRELLLYPLAFSDIVEARLHSIADSDADFATMNQLYGATLAESFAELALWGGYPAVVTSANSAERIEQLHQIYDTYVTRDVSQFLRVARPDLYNKLVKLLASQVGSQISWEGMASELRCSSETVRKYVAMLEGTYICQLVTPHTGSKATELRKTPKEYFVDTGLRNATLANFTPLEDRPDRGHLFEQTVVQELAKLLQPTDELHYWRTKGSNEEVDAVIVRGDRVLPIEIKDNLAGTSSVPAGLARFITDRHPTLAIVATHDTVAEQKVGQTQVQFIPAPLLLARRRVLFNLLEEGLS